MKKKKQISKKQCIQAICNFVGRYRKDVNTTPLAMYADTGYSQNHMSITQDDIAAVIRNDLSLIDDWERFSEDKRWTPAWGFWKCSEKKWIVGNFLQTGKSSYQVSFEDPVKRSPGSGHTK